MISKEVIGQRIRLLRGDTPREVVAVGVGISVSALAMYETGQRVPRDEVKVRIADFFHKTVQELFFAS